MQVEHAKNYVVGHAAPVLNSDGRWTEHASERNTRGAREMVTVIEVETNARGDRAGAGHRWTKWPRAVVDQAIAMREAGMQLKDISEALGGPALSTVHYWATGQRRRPPARVVVKRVKERDSFGTNHQRSASFRADQPEKQAPADDSAIASAGPLPTVVPSPANRRG